MNASLLDREVARFKALAHPARLRILAMLRDGELCACQLTAVLELAPSTVSAHLAELRRAGWLEERRQGRWVWSRLVGGADARRQLTRIWHDLDEDPVIRRDAELLARLRRVPLEALCEAGFDLVTVGVRRAGKTNGNRGMS